MLQTNIAGSRTQGVPSTDGISMYKTTTGSFLNSDQQAETKILQKDAHNARPAGSSKKFKKQKKDDILKMINQLELGENSDTFRHLAKQFYLQNVNISKQSNKVGSGKQSVILSADGSLTKDGLTDDPIAAFKIQNQSVSSQQNSTKLTTKGTAGKQSTDA